jgi:2-methylcitrate dehydratase PrpD
MPDTAPDPGHELWRQARGTAATAGPDTLDRAAGCLGVALADAVVSARDPRHRAVAQALGGPPGPCTIAGGAGRAALAGAALANSYLVHARLTDDSYRVAAHPGLAVVPVALAVAEHLPEPPDGDRLLRAVVGGYECACRIADRLLPDVAERGFRVTAVVAPVAAAATAALLMDLPDDTAAAALGLAAASAGGPLGVVSTDGDGWRLQPALAVQAGVSAALAAAAGLRVGPGAFAGPYGLLALFGGVAPPAPTARTPRPAVHDVTFKRFPVAMYGQSIFGAARDAPPTDGVLERIAVRVAPFAAAYGGQGGASTRSSIASVEGITLGAVAAFLPALATGGGGDGPPVEVIGDPDLPALAARVTLGLAGGREIVLDGDGDTSGWASPQFEGHCAELLGDGGRFWAAIERLDVDGPAPLLAAWRTSV